MALDGEESRHLLKSRRMRPGERFELQGPDGRRFAAEVLSVGRNGASVAVREALPVPPLPRLRVTLLQAAVKDKAAEFIVQKSTEMGVTAICFFPSENTALPRKMQAAAGQTAQNQTARWERIAWEACKQSGRQFPPHIANVPGLEALLRDHPVEAGSETRGWLLHPGTAPGMGEAHGMAAAPGPGALMGKWQADSPQALYILVGPEGGFSESEVAAALAAGYSPAGLGGTILRAETAALAACAVALLGTG